MYLFSRRKRGKSVLLLIRLWVEGEAGGGGYWSRKLGFVGGGGSEGRGERCYFCLGRGSRLKKIAVDGE